MWASTVPQTVPAGVAQADYQQLPQVMSALTDSGSVFVGGAAGDDGKGQGLSPDAVERLRHATGCDVVLVETQVSTGTPLRADARPPVWPPVTHMAFAVGHVGSVGRIYGAATVAGVQLEREDNDAGEPRRVTSADVLGSVEAVLDCVPPGVFSVPFFTGFGSMRDIDGMFALVSKLTERDTIKVVCLAELQGDERRDAADLAGLRPGSDQASALAGERVYAVYSADLDDESEAPD